MTEKIGFLEKKGKRRFFVVKGSMLSWYLSDITNNKSKVQIQGSLPLIGAIVSIPCGGCCISIKSATGKLYQLKAASSSDADSWATAIRAASKYKPQESSFGLATNTQGWVTKKYIGTTKIHKRYLVLSDYLKYYDTDAWSSATPKGEVFLGAATVHLIDTDTFVVSVLGRDYPWVSSDAAGWVKSIQAAINKTNQKLEASFAKHQFLRIKKATKWCVLTTDFKFLWYTTVIPPEKISVHPPDGILDVSQVSNILRGDNSLTLISGTKSLMISFSDDRSFQEWFDHLTLATKRRLKPVSAKKRLVFGQPLSAIVSREGNEVPQIMMDCVEFILEYGTSVQGVMRLSGSLSEIEKYTDIYNNGEKVQFGPQTDVHAVTGLLKSFLREIPEPLLTFKLYEQILQAPNPKEMRQVLTSLPSSHYAATKYLFKFLFDLSLHHTKTSMGSANLALVIAPNVLRSKTETSIEETPLTLKVTQRLIDKYYGIFEKPMALMKNDPTIEIPFDEIQSPTSSPLPPGDLPPSFQHPSDLPHDILPPDDLPPSLDMLDLPTFQPDSPTLDTLDLPTFKSELDTLDLPTFRYDSLDTLDLPTVKPGSTSSFSHSPSSSFSLSPRSPPEEVFQFDNFASPVSSPRPNRKVPVRSPSIEEVSAFEEMDSFDFGGCEALLGCSSPPNRSAPAFNSFSSSYDLPLSPRHPPLSRAQTYNTAFQSPPITMREPSNSHNTRPAWLQQRAITEPTPIVSQSAPNYGSGFMTSDYQSGSVSSVHSPPSRPAWMNKKNNTERRY